MIIGAAVASLAGGMPASAAGRPSSLPAAHAIRVVAAAGNTHGALLPSGARPAAPPAAGTGAAGRISRDIAAVVGCYNNQSIKSNANGRWVSAELGYSGGSYAMLRARATAIGPWEKYDLCYDYTGSFWFIVSDANAKDVSAELGYSGGNYAMLRARASAVGPGEKYSLYCTTAGALLIKSNANGLWVSAELGYAGSDYAMLRARASAVGPWEQYRTLSGQGGC